MVKQEETIQFLMEHIPSLEDVEKSNYYCSIEKYRQRVIEHSNLFRMEGIRECFQKENMSLYNALLLADYNESWDVDFYNCSYSEISRARLSGYMEEIINLMDVEEIKKGYAFNRKYGVFGKRENISDVSLKTLLQIEKFEQERPFFKKSDTVLEIAEKKTKHFVNVIKGYQKK